MAGVLTMRQGNRTISAMSRSRRWAGLVLGVVGAIGAVATPARAAKPRIAIIGLSMGDVTAEVRIKMNAAIVGGLIASGAEVADSTATGRAMAERGMVACDTATCLTEIGKATSAAYVMRGSMEMTGRSYIVRLEMIDAGTATVIDTREDRCEICTENEAYETASVSASALKSQVFRRRVGAVAVGSSAASASATSPPPARPAPSPGTTAAVTPLISLAPVHGRDEPTMLVDTPAPPETSSPGAGSGGGPGALTWAAGAVALAAVATGVTLIAIDNGGTCVPMSTCTGHKTLTGGLILTGVGFAAAVASVLAYTRRF